MNKVRGLYAIADNSFRPEFEPFELAERFLKGGCRTLQLRMKSEKLKIKEQAIKIIDFKKRYDFTFIVNDDVDIAMEVGADGVHVGKNDLAIGEIRKQSGSKLIIGYSSHSLEEAQQAEEMGADYVAFGAIFPTKTKGPGHPVQGLEKLKQVVEQLTVPVVAIGGINHENLKNVLETGVAAIAMITALTQANNIAEVTSFFVSHL